MLFVCRWRASNSQPANATRIWSPSIDALEKLAAEDARQARVVELRFFGGLSMEEAARVLGVSVRTAHSDWAFARAWLYRELSDKSAV